MQQAHTITADDLTRIDGDMYGNPRYVVHFLALGLPDYAHNARTRRAGLELYRGKKYGGMFVTQYYGSREQLAEHLNSVMFGECQHVYVVRNDTRARKCRYCGEKRID